MMVKKEALAPRCMLWRKPDEGLLMSARGKKDDSGGRVASFFVSIAYIRGVVYCEQMSNRKITGESFGDISRSQFPRVFEKMNNPDKRLVLPDGCPVQNSAKAIKTFNDIDCEIFQIPRLARTLTVLRIFSMLFKNILMTR